MALGVVAASSANTKTAEAHSGKAAVAAAASVSTATTMVTAVISPIAPATKLTATPVKAAASETITPPPANPYLENPKLRRLQKEEVSQSLLDEAARIVRKHHAKPVGTQVEVDVDGKHIVARIERHFHPEGGPVKPWGFHPGVSLFVYR